MSKIIFEDFSPRSSSKKPAWTKINAFTQLAVDQDGAQIHQVFPDEENSVYLTLNEISELKIAIESMRFRAPKKETRTIRKSVAQKVVAVNFNDRTFKKAYELTKVSQKVPQMETLILNQNVKIMNYQDLQKRKTVQIIKYSDCIGLLLTTLETILAEIDRQHDLMTCKVLNFPTTFKKAS